MVKLKLICKERSDYLYLDGKMVALEDSSIVVDMDKNVADKLPGVTVEVLGEPKSAPKKEAPKKPAPKRRNKK
jgi:hypothetical protein